MHRTTSTIVLLALLLAAACNSEPYTEDSVGDEPTSDHQGTMAEFQGLTNTPSSGNRAAASGTKVAILDHGLRMARGTQVIPDDWKLSQDIATDPNTAKLARYHLEIRGPEGELIKGLRLTAYGQAVGTGFGQALQQMTLRGLGGEIQDLSIGNPQRSVTLERTPEFQKAIRLGQERGFQAQALEAPIKGSRNGSILQGVVYIWHFSNPNMPGMGSLQGTAVAAPPERFKNAVRTSEQIAHSYRANPQFEQLIMQVSAAAMQRSNAQHERMMAQSRAQHQQRMADNQARFNSHQQTMKGIYDANDQQHEQWMDDFRNSGTSAWSGSDYTGHDAYIDGIHERSSFQDPYSGQQVSRDGQYDNWYNNGQGDYYGTDDPNFDPSSMDGNWQRIEPLEPNP